MKLARSCLGAGSARWLLAPLTLRCRATVSANPAGFIAPGDHHLGQQSRYESGRVPNGIRTAPSNSTATRIDTLFHKVIYADNSTAAHYLTAAVSDGSTTQTRHAWLPQATTALDYDDDGNLTDDGQWSYVWDGENRLVSMETTFAAVTAGRPFRKLAFAYDWTGRRLARTITDTNNAILSATRWLNDGWNPVAEYSLHTSSLILHTSYLWGIDISGTLQGAGGVGGLLSCVSQSTVFLPSFDGNGNITAWTQSGASAPVCRREYDAFGNIVVEQGAAPCAIGFSTKIEDPETGLLYYGHRYYQPPTGRWLSEDPIEEEGGMNLYGFVRNDGVGGFDFLGHINPLDDESRRRLDQLRKDPTGHETCEQVERLEKEFGTMIKRLIEETKQSSMNSDLADARIGQLKAALTAFEANGNQITVQMSTTDTGAGGFFDVKTFKIALENEGYYYRCDELHNATGSMHGGAIQGTNIEVLNHGLTHARDRLSVGTQMDYLLIRVNDPLDRKMANQRESRAIRATNPMEEAGGVPRRTEYVLTRKKLIEIQSVGRAVPAADRGKVWRDKRGVVRYGDKPNK